MSTGKMTLSWDKRILVEKLYASFGEREFTSRDYINIYGGTMYDVRKLATDGLLTRVVKGTNKVPTVYRVSARTVKKITHPRKR